MTTFEDLITSFATKRVLVVGDVMLDRFVYGSVRRISPEAPVQVIDANEPEEIAGGATLFHEHMSFTPDFMPRWMEASRAVALARNPAATLPAVQTPPAPPAGEKYFLQDADLMTDEMSKAKADGLA